MEPDSYKSHLNGVTGVVHAIGTLFEDNRRPWLCCANAVCPESQRCCVYIRYKVALGKATESQQESQQDYFEVRRYITVARQPFVTPDSDGRR